MKIVILGSFANHLLLFRESLMQEMLQEGHDVIACVPNASPEVRNRLESMGIQYRHLPLERTGLNPIKDIRTILSLCFFLRRSKPDMVLAYTVKPVIYGSIAGRFAGVSKIYSMITGLGYAFTGKDSKSVWVSRIVRMLYRLSVKHNRKIFFQNPDDSEIFRNLKFVTRKQSVLINGSGIDTESFKPTAFPEKISFLLIARLIRDKGVLEYAEAARMLKKKYPHVAFRLVGWMDNGNPASVSKQELEPWVRRGSIEYLGKLTDVRPAIANSSVYVLPSYREGTPRSVLEAMSMGRPVVTTDAPGCRETVLHGKNGYLVPVKKVSELAEAMERFIRQPESAEQMGKASRQMAVEKYDVRKVNNSILRAMELR